MPAEPTAPAVPHADTDWPWKIPLRRRNGTVRAYVLVDEGDYEALNAWRWHVLPTKYGVYAARQVPAPGPRRKQHPMLMHRQLLGLAIGDPRQGDHINRDRLDCRRSNLRVLEPGGNEQNVGANRGARSAHRGVSRLRTGRWQAEVQISGVRYYLGVFDDEDEAGRVAAAFRREHMPYSVEA